MILHIINFIYNIKLIINVFSGIKKLELILMIIYICYEFVIIKIKEIFLINKTMITQRNFMKYDNLVIHFGILTRCRI